MKSNNKLYKNIGILIGIVAVLAVIIVSFKEESPSNNSANNTVNSVAPSAQDTSVPTDSNTNNTPQAGATNTPVVTPVTAPKKGSYTYKNGTYSAMGSYMTPEGQVAINVSVTITDDIITDANVTSASGDRTSVRYQNKFISGYKQYVVGKNIADVQLSKVSGSSLTPDGFNNALSQIKSQAKA